MQKDTEIAHKIKDAITKDERTAGLHVNIKVIGGVAFLDGQVPIHADKDAVAKIAKGVEGVRFVQDRLLVKAEQPSGRNLLEGTERR